MRNQADTTRLKRLLGFGIALVAMAILAVVFKPILSRVGTPMIQHMRGQKTIEDRMAQYGPAVRERLKPDFAKANVLYPPSSVTLVALKQERILEVYTAGSDGRQHFVRQYPIRGASGTLGPKLREGDAQVPEGIYPITFLNPNSQFHLSLRVGYPNAFDQEQARKEGRTDLGGDIMIHGGAGSAGCLAMGDEAAEDLFVLAADTKPENVSVVICPLDFRRGRTVPASPPQPEWTGPLYLSLRDRLKGLPEPG